MSRGIIYQNICIYRMVMNLLYGFSYKKRFRLIAPHIQGLKVNELCFGDLIIAQYCRKNMVTWHGYDINERFVSRANGKNFSATLCDLEKQKSLPDSDTCIIVGSLYHFKKNPEHIYDLMFSTATRIIISEPVKNLSSKKNFIGRLAAKMSDAGSGAESFRYNETELLKSIEIPAKKYNFTISKKEYFRKDLILILDKCKTPK
jgi:hypothetical protein